MNEMAVVRRDALAALVTGFAGTSADDRVRRAVADGLGGVILFSRNVESAEQLTALTASLRAERDDLLIAIDHEGGEFSHLSPVNDWPSPSPRLLGELADPELTRACAREAAELLASFGIDVMLAPSVDVNSNPANPIISTRSFGATARVVAEQGVAFVAGVRDAGIAACAKHFPGHGDVAVDSHLELPYVERWAEEIERTELPPFAAVIDAGVDLVMSAHVVFTDYDTRPASLSHRLSTGLLRDELGFAGVLTTDALEMQAVTGFLGDGPDVLGRAAVEAVRAGADLAMVAIADADPAALADALVTAVRTDQLPPARLDEAATRVRRLATSLRPKKVGLDPRVLRTQGAGVREVAARAVAAQEVPRLDGTPYVIDLAQPRHPAWNPCFEGLPEVFGTAGVVLRSADPAAVDRALEEAGDRPLVVGVQDMVRTPWMADALRQVLGRRTSGVVVLCTGIGEDTRLVPSEVPVVATSGRNIVVLRAIARALLDPVT